MLQQAIHARESWNIRDTFLQSANSYRDGDVGNEWELNIKLERKKFKQIKKNPLFGYKVEEIIPLVRNIEGF